MTIQIIGQNLDVAFQELPIEAKKLYESKENEYGNKYQVWKLTESEHEKFGLVEEDDWKESYGWWRSGGCNQSPVFLDFTVNGKQMIGFKNEHSWYHSEDCLSELEEDEEPTLPSYSSFSDWFSEYMGLSKPENLAFFAHSLAEYNGLTIAEFFKKFEG